MQLPAFSPATFAPLAPPPTLALRPAPSLPPRRRLRSPNPRAARIHCAIDDAPSPRSLLEPPAPLRPSQWNFRGFTVDYISYPTASPSASPPPAIVLVHGFGANCLHWRLNLRPLAARGYDVYAMDLLGFGMGDKPPAGTLDAAGARVAYDFDYWTTQLRAFVAEVVQRPRKRPVFFGANSIGCMVTMQASVEDASVCRAHAFISPSLRLLNVRKRAWVQGVLASGLMRLLAFRPLGGLFLDALAQPRALRGVLLQAYKVRGAVDDELVEMLLRPARTPGALGVFLAFITYDGGPIPEDFLPRLAAPALMLWGAGDDFEPVRLGRALGEYECVEKFVEMPGVGHCGQDEAPEVVNREMAAFFAKCAEGEEAGE